MAAVVPAAIFGVLTHLNVGLDSAARIAKLYPPLTVLTVFIGLLIGLVWVRRYIEEFECKGTIVEVDYSPPRAAAQQLSDWHGRGFDTLIFKYKSFPTPNSKLQVVRSCAKKTISDFQVTPHLFELEISKLTACRNFEQTLSLTSQLHDCGLKLCIDAFGTGHTPLHYMQQMAVESLKIDSSFVQ